jgi:hypothetical protein
MHFEYIPYKQRDMVDFYRYQFFDICKTYWAISYGIKVIRISYKEMKYVHQHIVNALKLQGQWYFSNIDLYDYIINPDANAYEKCEFENGIMTRYRKNK